MSGDPTVPAYPPPETRSLIRDEPKRHPATAHFPIEGSPENCRSCRHFLKGQRKIGRCLKWAAFKGLVYRLAPAYRADHNDWWRGLPTISREIPACKYFEARP